MVKGGLDPNFDYVIRPGKKGTAGGSALDPGDVVILDNTLTPDGWKKANATTNDAAGVNINRVEDAETELEVILRGPVRVKAEGTIPANSFVKTGTAGGVIAWTGGTTPDPSPQKKGYFAGLHDKPVTGTPSVLQDPQTIKDAATNDIIIVDWGNV